MSATAAPSPSRTPLFYNGRVTEMFPNEREGGNHSTEMEDCGPLAERIAAAEAGELAARASSQAKADLLAMMGHELRTPLNAISGYVQLLTLGVYGPVSPDQHGILMRVDRAQRHLLRLVTDLTDVLRLESGHLAINVADVRLGDLAPDLESMIGPQARARSIAFIITSDDDCVVRADRERLLQILINLLSNAIKYTPPGGDVRITAGAEHGLAHIDVTDTGIGMTPDELDHLFTKFYRSTNRLAREAGGTGLGLAICRSLVELHGGQIAVRSSPGHGSTFSVFLPIDGSNQPLVGNDERTSAAVSAGSSRAGPPVA